MTRPPRPPRIAEAILSLALPPRGYRESVLGDMYEAFAAKASDPAVGPRAARLWYWQHALRVAGGYAARRWTRRRRYAGFTGSRMDDVDGGRTGMWGETWRDVRLALRSYRRNPGIAVVALVTLGLAVGANTAVFSVVNEVYLTPLGFDDPERIVRIGLERMDTPGSMSVHTAGDFAEWRESTTAFSDMAAWGYRTVTLERGEIVERVTVSFSVGSLFDVLGVNAVEGRAFSAREEGPGAENLAVLSRATRLRLYGPDEPAVGSVLRIDGVPHEVIGVMPADFQYPSAAALWTTAPFEADALVARNDYFLRTVARLAPGVPLERAREEMAAIAADTRARLPESYGGIGIAVQPLPDLIVAGAGTLWLTLMAGVSLVLLIACVNIANLLLSRSTSRREEFAVRRALGAGTRRLVRQTLIESVVLGLMGGFVGLAVGGLLLEAILTWMPGGVPRASTIGIDGAVLVFSLLLSAAAGLVFGVLPAVQAHRDGIGQALRKRRGASRLRTVLVTVEVALTTVLLAVGGLTFRSFLALSGEDTGLDVERLALLPMRLPDDRGDEERSAYYARLLERLRALPEVESVALVSSAPVVDFTPGAWVNEPGVVHGERRPGAKYQIVSPGYFETAGLSILRGRGLTADDGIDGTRSVVISQAAADELFPGEDPIGKRFDLGMDGSVAPVSTVVGVVSDVRLDGLTQPMSAAVYGTPELMPWWRYGFQVMIRLIPGADVPPAWRPVVAELDSTVPILSLRRMEDLLGDALTGRRNTTLLFGVLGTAALVMAAIGVFGVLAYVVARRTREIGIRIAVGADRGSVRALVFREGLPPVLIGLVTGVTVTAGLGRLLEGLLFGVELFDAPTVAGVSVLLIAVASLAIWVPSRRATRVDPVRVLASE